MWFKIKLFYTVRVGNKSWLNLIIPKRNVILSTLYNSNQIQGYSFEIFLVIYIVEHAVWKIVYNIKKLYIIKNSVALNI